MENNAETFSTALQNLSEEKFALIVFYYIIFIIIMTPHKFFAQKCSFKGIHFVRQNE
jgi:hypothetical protein